MKRILVFLFALMVFLPIKVKAQSLVENKIDSLNIELSNLSHELNYLKLSYEIYTLNTDIKFFTKEIDGQIKDIKMSLYHRDFDKRMYRQYELLYTGYKKI